MTSYLSTKRFYFSQSLQVDDIPRQKKVKKAWPRLKRFDEKKNLMCPPLQENAFKENQCNQLSVPFWSNNQSFQRWRRKRFLFVFSEKTFEQFLFRQKFRLAWPPLAIKSKEETHVLTKLKCLWCFQVKGFFNIPVMSSYVL